MSKLDFHKNSNPLSPPPRLLPVLQKLKDGYILWHEYHAVLPKTQRYSLGKRIDVIFIQIIETISAAVFAKKEEKLPLIKISVRKLDTIKILLLILWESKSLDDKKYISLSQKVDEVGRMLGGWTGQLLKQNSPGKPEEK